MSKTKRRVVQVLVALGLVAFGAAGLMKLSASKPGIEKQKPPVVVPVVRTVSVHTASLPVMVRAEGTVRPLQQTQLVPQVAGKLVYVSPSLVNGGTFSRGDVLLRIDPVDYELAMTLARAKVKDSESRLQLAREESAAAREEWRLHMKEGEKMASDPPPLVAKEPQLAAAGAALEGDRANLKKAELALERTELSAPFTGRVSRESVDIGQYVSPGQALATLYSTDAAEIVLPLEMEDLSWVHVPGFTPGEVSGSIARVHARIGGKAMSWTGEVVRAEGELDERTRMINVVVRVDEPYAERPPLAVGLFVTVQIEGRTVPKGALVPRAALRKGVVWVVKEGRLRFRSVDVARIEGESVLVKSGLSNGDEIVISPLKAVTDGMSVRIAKAKEESGS
jgi:membrane fusion protein, multidrug efflux system